MNTILLAVRCRELDEMIDVLTQYGYSIYTIDLLAEITQIPDDIKIAFIDEDFNGPQTGWQLASKIRQMGAQIKIAMIVRKNPTDDLDPLYDVTMGFPISDEELVGEIKRKWPIG